MLNQKYKSAITHSLEERKQMQAPQMNRFISGVVLFLISYLFLCWIGSPSDDKSFQFTDESGALTALSAIFMSLAGGFAGIIYYCSRSLNQIKGLFWLLSMVGLLFFALDELMKIHEALGYLTKQVAGESKTFRNWNDVIVIGYGIVGLGGLVFFLPEILRFPRLCELLVAAFLFYALHTVIDATFEPKTLMSGIFEESSKLFSAAFLALSMLAGLLSVLKYKENQLKD